MAKVRIRKRGKTYSYVFEAGRQDGKRKTVEKGGFPTKAAAYEAGVAAFSDWRHGNIGITSERVTVKAFLQSWLENVARLNVRESSYRLYSRIAECRIVPYIGSISVQDVTPALLDSYMRKLAAMGLARNTIASTWHLLRQVLDYAVYPAGLVQGNASRFIKVPRSAPRNVVKRTIISREMYDSLMERHPFGTIHHIPIALLFHTGMRIGEALGLCWDDVDFGRKCIHIRRQYCNIQGAGTALVSPKTATSVRDVIVDDGLLGMLSRWKEAQEEQERRLGDAYCVVDELEGGMLHVHSKGLGLPSNRRRMVCTSGNGRPVSRSAVTQCLQKEGLNSHSFRHSHATLLVEAGAPLKGVAGRLGHKRLETTDVIYAHNTEKLQESTAAIFAKSMQTKPKCRQNADK